MHLRASYIDTASGFSLGLKLTLYIQCRKFQAASALCSMHHNARTQSKSQTKTQPERTHHLRDSGPLGLGSSAAGLARKRHGPDFQNPEDLRDLGTSGKWFVIPFVVRSFSEAD